MERFTNFLEWLMGVILTASGIIIIVFCILVLLLGVLMFCMFLKRVFMDIKDRREICYHGEKMGYINKFIFKGQRVDNGEYVIGRIGLPYIVNCYINKPNEEVETEMWVYENKNKKKPWKMYYVKTETIVML